MAEVISIINMKGGVGKTTLSVGIADYLSDIGRKVLIIDADPQFNTTQALLSCYKEGKDHKKNFYIDEVKNKQKTIFELFDTTVRIVEEDLSPPTSGELIIKLKDNLGIICGDLSLVMVSKINDYRNAEKIRNFMEDNALREEYDYIIIDCPPTMSIYTESALKASDYYLIPNRIDRYSIIGINSLQRAIKTLIKQERITIKCIGLVYTMVEKNMPKKQEMLKISFESETSLGEIEIFATNMKICNQLQFGKRGPMPKSYKSSREDLEGISLELVEKIKKYKEEM